MKALSVPSFPPEASFGGVLSSTPTRCQSYWLQILCPRSVNQDTSETAGVAVWPGSTQPSTQGPTSELSISKEKTAAKNTWMSGRWCCPSIPAPLEAGAGPQGLLPPQREFKGSLGNSISRQKVKKKVGVGDVT